MASACGSTQTRAGQGSSWRRACTRRLLPAAASGGHAASRHGVSAPAPGLAVHESPNRRLLRLQSPALAAEPAWAHTTAAPQAGGLLLATADAPRVLGSYEWGEVVVLLVHHSGDGSAGLVLNRPTTKRVGHRSASGVPVPREGQNDGLFNSRVYWGGPTEDGALLLLHGDPGARLHPRCSLELAPGLYLELSRLAVARAACGDLSRGTLRFFSGCCTWGPGELEQQLAAGAWQPAAASRALVLKHAAQLPQGLWHELACMAGMQAGAACQV